MDAEWWARAQANTLTEQDIRKAYLQKYACGMCDGNGAESVFVDGKWTTQDCGWCKRSVKTDVLPPSECT